MSSSSSQSSTADTTSTVNTATSTPQPDVVSWAALFSSAYIWRVIAVTGGVALHATNVMIVATIMPSVVQDIGGIDYYAWGTTLFILASIFGSTLAIPFMVRFGAGKSYQAMLAIFMVGTLVCALAPNMLMLLLGRTVQGFGGGVLVALSYALIRLVFDPPFWPRAIATVSAMWGIATILGPAAGGIFAQYGMWRWSFGVLLPVALIQAAIVAKQLKKDKAPEKDKILVPWRSLFFLMASVLMITVSSLEKSSNALMLLGCVSGILLGVLAIWLDRKSTRAQILPEGAYRSGAALGLVYLCVFLLQIGSMFEIYIPYFLQFLHGLGPLMAGYLTAVFGAGWSTASLLSSGRSGARATKMLYIGSIWATVSLVALAVFLPWQWSSSIGIQLILITLALAGAGVGIGSTWPHFLTRVMLHAPPGQGAKAAAAGTTVQLYGLAIGSSLAGLVVNAAGVGEGAQRVSIEHAALWLSAGFVIFPCMAIVLSIRLANAPIPSHDPEVG